MEIPKSAPLATEDLEMYIEQRLVTFEKSDHHAKFVWKNNLKLLSFEIPILKLSSP